MTKIFNNLSETIGVFSAFVVFYFEKYRTSEFLAFPLCMLLGWRVAAYFKNNEKGRVNSTLLLLNKLNE